MEGERLPWAVNERVYEGKGESVNCVDMDDTKEKHEVGVKQGKALLEEVAPELGDENRDTLAAAVLLFVPSPTLPETGCVASASTDSIEVTEFVADKLTDTAPVLELLCNTVRVTDPAMERLTPADMEVSGLLDTLPVFDKHKDTDGLPVTDADPLPLGNCVWVVEIVEL